MAQVDSREDEDIERVLRRFKRQVKDERILNDVRSKEVYEKPTEKRKRVKNDQVRKERQRRRKEEW